MKLTIIPNDGAVYKNDICFLEVTLENVPLNVHALQWNKKDGWIEYSDGSANQEIQSLPDWAVSAVAAWEIEYNKRNMASPPPSSEQNKATASAKLSDTDWTTIPDVSDSLKSNPYLTNVDEFLTYRNAIRAIAINPVSGYIDFPTVPKAIWNITQGTN
jgi:PIN domain nuclease of toxin-antitoxin system